VEGGKEREKQKTGEFFYYEILGCKFDYQYNSRIYVSERKVIDVDIGV